MVILSVFDWKDGMEQPTKQTLPPRFTIFQDENQEILYSQNWQCCFSGIFSTIIASDMLLWKLVLNIFQINLV